MNRIIKSLSYAQSVQGALSGNRYAFSIAARFRVTPLKSGVLKQVTTK